MPDPARPPCILVVDDDAALIEFLAIFLREEGYAVSLAANGQEALNQLDHVLPDLVLTDLQMPLMDGGTLCRQLHERTPTPPVIFMSAGLDPRRAADQYGAAGWLAKPFDLDDLLAVVQRVVGRRPAANPLSCDGGEAV